MTESVIVKAKIKEVITGFNVGGDVADKLNDLAVKTIATAAERAEGNGRKTVQAKDVFVGDITSGGMLVVKSKVKELVDGYNVSGDFAEALNEVLKWYLSQASARAEANGRKTVMAKDL
jgi:histone H3/H4